MHWLDDNESLPQYRPARPHVLQIGHTPVLLDNAETCANVALIGRYGAGVVPLAWARPKPGTTLVSVSGALDASDRPGGRARHTAARRSSHAARRRPRPPGGPARRLRRLVARRRAPRRRLTQRGPRAPGRVAWAPASSSSCRERRAVWSRHCGSRAGWPTKAPASADRAPSACPRSPRTSHSWPRDARRPGRLRATRRALRRDRGPRRVPPPRRRRALVRSALRGVRARPRRPHARSRPAPPARSDATARPCPHLEREEDLVWE